MIEATQVKTTDRDPAALLALDIRSIADAFGGLEQHLHRFEACADNDDAIDEDAFHEGLQELYGAVARLGASVRCGVRQAKRLSPFRDGE